MLKIVFAIFAFTCIVGAAPPSDDNEIDPKSFIKDEVTEPKQFPSHERKAVCRKYEGQYIAYAGNVYFVQECKAREVHNSELILTLNRKRTPILPVESGEIARLDTGAPIVDGNASASTKKRRCQDFAGSYVTFSYTDVYLVKNCEKLLFPDWESYITHRKKSGVKGDVPIVALTWDEFASLKAGPDMPSILDKAFGEQLDIGKSVEVIPIDEACKGLEGRYATFHSKMYMIEKCRKREIDAQDLTMRFRSRMPKFIEMTAEQWYSMPDGKPYRPK